MSISGNALFVSPHSVRSVNSVAKYFFWLWLIALLVLNVIPLGNETSHSLSGNRVVFRLDYLIHLISFLAFAWVVILGRVSKQPLFSKYELLKFATVVIVAACGFEMVQIVLPYRAFNPVDLMFNMSGAVVGIMVVWVSRRCSQIKSAD